MSGEIENLRQLITRLDEVQLNIETASEVLDRNFENYKNVSDISGNISEKNQEVLDSINTLQINAVESVEDAIKKATDLKAEMSKYYSAEYSQTKKDLDSLSATIKNELDALNNTIKETVEKSVNDLNIDTSKLSEIIDEKVNKVNFSPLEDSITSHSENVDNLVNAFEDANTRLNESAVSLSNKEEQINNAVKNINTANKSVSIAMTIAMIATGIAIGFGIATFFKIDALSDYYFSEYEEKVKYEKEVNKELLENMNDASKLERWLIANKVKVRFGKVDFNGKKRKYISIPQKYSTDQYISQDKSSVTILK